MAKNIYLIIIGIVTAICILAGCFIHLGIPGIQVITGYGYTIFEKSDGERVNEATLSDAYSRIDIDAQALSVNIVTGDENTFEYIGPKEYSPKINVDNGVATITQKGIRPSINNSTNGISLTITVSNTNFSDVNIDLDFGEINIDGISAESLWISADCGSVKVKNGKFTDAVVEADLGEVEFRDASFGKSLEIEADCGSVTIKNPGDLRDADIEAETDLGTVKISTDDTDYSGKSYKRNGTGVKIRLHADLGEIRIEN